MNDFNQQHNSDYEYDRKPETRPIYEQIWFIVVVFICFWPAGIILAIWRFIRDQQISAVTQDLPPLSDQAEAQEDWETAHQAAEEERKQKLNKSKIQSKRSCKTWKIWGWILIVLGIITLINLPTMDSTGSTISSLATGAGFVIAGLILLIAARRTVQKWDRYESFINNKGNTSIPFLADRMGYSEKTVRVDVQDMINKGFFDKPKQGLSAYINGEYDLLVMTKYGEPMQPLRKAEPIKKEEKPPANSYIAKLQQEMARTKDEELLETLHDMEGSIKRIEAKIQEEPSLGEMTNIRKLKEQYLPQTLELIRKFNDGEGSDETRWEIKAMLGTCAKAFKNIEGKVYERDDIDTKVDMEVLRKTLEREGLLGSDFDIKS